MKKYFPVVVVIYDIFFIRLSSDCCFCCGSSNSFFWGGCQHCVIYKHFMITLLYLFIHYTLSALLRGLSIWPCLGSSFRWVFFFLSSNWNLLLKLITDWQTDRHTAIERYLSNPLSKWLRGTVSQYWSLERTAVKTRQWNIWRTKWPQSRYLMMGTV